MSVEHTDYLVVGAGITGLAFARFASAAEPEAKITVFERESTIGGYCRTIHRGGFVWDYSGHFFHFRDPEIEADLRAQMPADEVRTIVKIAKIRHGDRLIDFPFQKNIHQLPRELFLRCLHDLYFAEDAGPPYSSFKQMLISRLGESICDEFLVPYNEKLYACDLDRLDSDAMGRFFPHAEIADIVRNFVEPDPASYNTSFTYPQGGAIRYVEAMAARIPDGVVQTDEAVVHIDVKARLARTATGRELSYRHLISTAPLPRLLRLIGQTPPVGIFTANKVLVYNLGFDRKGPTGVHWIYLPDREFVFYRVGFYDNIFESHRMSLYVEVGLDQNAEVPGEATLERVIADLEKAGIKHPEQNLVAWHQVVLDPAYCHLSSESIRQAKRVRGELAGHGIHSIGRYGAWTYCSIEDNIIEARDLAGELSKCSP